MTSFYEWLRTIIGCLCLLELLYHIVPNETYQRYLRFFGGMIFLLITMGPVMNLLQMRTSFEEALRKFSLEEEASRLAEAGSSLAQLQNEAIDDHYRAELVRQIERIAQGHGRTPVKTEVATEYGEDGTPGIREVKMKLWGKTAGIEEIAQEICAVYGLERKAVNIWAGDGA